MLKAKRTPAARKRILFPKKFFVEGELLPAGESNDGEIAGTKRDCDYYDSLLRTAESMARRMPVSASALRLSTRIASPAETRLILQFRSDRIDGPQIDRFEIELCNQGLAELISRLLAMHQCCRALQHSGHLIPMRNQTGLVGNRAMSGNHRFHVEGQRFCQGLWKCLERSTVRIIHYRIGHAARPRHQVAHMHGAIVRNVNQHIAVGVSAPRIDSANFLAPKENACLL